jgi:ribosomal protein S18 acetylase RimI-like enzyme
METREAKHDDIPAIQEVAHRSWETDYPDVLSRETIDEAVEEWYSEERLAEERSSEDAVLLVVQDSGGVVAFSHAAWEEDSGDVLRLYVRPDRRQEGIGRHLLERTCDRLLARDVERVKAMVLADNDLGNDFYESMGFEQTGTATTEVGEESHRENVYVRERDQ